MKPTVGRIVHYVVPSGPTKGEVRAAMITRVWNLTCVNLHVYFDGEENVFQNPRMSSVCQTDETNMAPGGWFWPLRAA